MPMNLNRLNGWQRLWVVVSIIWVIFIGNVLAPSFPTEKKSLEFWSTTIAHTVYYSLSEAEKIYPRLISSPADIRKQFSELSDREFIESAQKIFPRNDLSKIIEDYRSSMSGMTGHQIESLGYCALSLFLPPAALYGIGLLLAWIRAGFKKQNT